MSASISSCECCGILIDLFIYISNILIGVLFNYLQFAISAQHVTKMTTLSKCLLVCVLLVTNLM